MIKCLRSCAIVFLFAFFGIGALILRYCIFPFQKSVIENRKALEKSWKFFVKLLIKTGIINIEVSSLEKIRSIKNSIIVSTHPSFIDILILMSIIPNSTCFVAEKLAKNPFFRGIVDLLFILETKSIECWLDASCNKLNEGLNLIIFPMGIRHKKNEHPKIRRGTALIAQKSKKNIVLLHLETDFDFLQINQPIYEGGNHTVTYSLDYLGEIDVEKQLEQCPDEVAFKTAVTKEISDILYKS